MAFIGVLYVKIMGFVQRGVSVSGALKENSSLGYPGLSGTHAGASATKR